MSIPDWASHYPRTFIAGFIKTRLISGIQGHPRVLLATIAAAVTVALVASSVGAGIRASSNDVTPTAQIPTGAVIDGATNPEACLML
jgi:hypothetical protein